LTIFFSFTLNLFTDCDTPAYQFSLPFETFTASNKLLLKQACSLSTGSS